MSEKREATLSEAETYTLRNRAGEAAELMARAASGDVEARAAYSRLLVEVSRTYGAYVSTMIGTRFKRAS